MPHSSPHVKLRLRIIVPDFSTHSLSRSKYLAREKRRGRRGVGGNVDTSKENVAYNLYN